MSVTRAGEHACTTKATKGGIGERVGVVLEDEHFRVATDAGSCAIEELEYLEPWCLDGA
jgi:hypothetical protein